MLNEYKVEIDILVDDKDEQWVIGFARRAYSQGGGARGRLEGDAGRPKEMRDISAEVGDIRAALMELAERNPLLQQVGLKIVGIAVGPRAPSSRNHRCAPGQSPRHACGSQELLEPAAILGRQLKLFFGSEHEPIYHTQVWAEGHLQ
jgi:hypothetical protein